MEREKRILFIDNEPLKIGAYVRRLRELGYTVGVITELEAAEAALASEWWHLVIVDLRMVDEQDRNDFSGLDLLSRHADDPAVCRLVFTSYPTYESMREALVGGPGKLPAAVDFLSKLDPLEKNLKRIQDAIEHRAGINWDLQTVFEGPPTFIGMYDWLRLNAPEKAIDIPSIEAAGEELDDLWGKLFPNQRKIVVYPFLPGRGNTLVSLVKPYTSGAESLVVVKYGWRKEVRQENANYHRWVEPYAGSFTTQLRTLQETLHFAGIKYSLVGGTVTEAKRFSDFYRANSYQEVIETVEHLFTQVCGPWFSQPERRSKGGLDRAYRDRMQLDRHDRREQLFQHLNELAANAENMGFRAEGDGLNQVFDLSDGVIIERKTLENWIYTPEIVLPNAMKDLLGEFPESLSHGDLNGSNILVDLETRHAWIIDFYHTGYGYRLRDFAELESCIALDLQKQTNLSVLLRFEELLASQQDWDQDLPLPDDLETRFDQALVKALKVIVSIRRHARQWQHNGDLCRYYLALFYEAVLRLVTDGRDSAAQPSPLWRRAHALLRAAVLIRELSKP